MTVRESLSYPVTIRQEIEHFWNDEEGLYRDLREEFKNEDRRDRYLDEDEMERFSAKVTVGRLICKKAMLELPEWPLRPNGPTLDEVQYLKEIFMVVRSHWMAMRELVEVYQHYHNADYIEKWSASLYLYKFMVDATAPKNKNGKAPRTAHFERYGRLESRIAQLGKKYKAWRNNYDQLPTSKAKRQEPKYKASQNAAAKCRYHSKKAKKLAAEHAAILNEKTETVEQLERTTPTYLRLVKMGSK